MSRARVVDAGLALGAGAIVATAALSAEEPGSRSSDLAGWLLALVVVGLLLVRRRHPVGVLAGLALVTVAYNMAGFAGIGFVWPMLLGLYTAAAAGHLAVAVGTGAAMTALDTGWLLVAERHPVLPVVAMSVPDVVVSGLAVALGDAVRSRRGWAAETRERLRRVEEETGRQARQAITEHRLRIAREIHDITAHTLAVVAVQINVAADALPDEPEEARRTLEVAADVSRQAIDELRTAVRVLRDDPGDPGGLVTAPPPGLPELDALVDGARATGLRVTLHRTGTPGPVSPTVALTAYRIVQEALTNVVKHASASRAEVRVGHDQGALRIEVTDDGRGPSGSGGGGHGLVGLAERAAGVGGTLTAGPGETGGFQVRARLPLGEAVR
ncbi:sensor histidine kinase [Thermomonospora cellulosilytica]|uniref:histidine kinase n=1 Tax=Thermomonospora cellulosilytica TaxID=1411118 RepID=A0A7W3MVA7_9ACTN|nr:histidine kinase [Thermomonospora cellulosilytica]MBA9002540.1 MYXO-CTERM domain-containing protein [Thermomonospora cellulosilytica]